MKIIIEVFIKGIYIYIIYCLGCFGGAKLDLTNNKTMRVHAVYWKVIYKVHLYSAVGAIRLNKYSKRTKSGTMGFEEVFS